MNGIVTADFKADYNEIELPYEIKKATILYNGCLTEKYDYLNEII